MSYQWRSIFSSIIQNAAFIALGAIALPVHSELAALSDNDLSEVDGAGIGFVMEDFAFSHGNDSSQGNVFRITGITDSDGNPVNINVNQMYIARAGSEYGDVIEGVNLGRLDNPYEIDLLDGNDIGLPGKGVLEIAAPRMVDSTLGYDCLDPSAAQGSGTCASRPASVDFEAGERPDIGFELEVNVAGQAQTHLNMHAHSAVFDGSYLRLWGEDSRMAAEYRLNFYTPALEISTCAVASSACTSKIKMSDFKLELALGNTFQPLYIGVDNTTGGFSFQIDQMTTNYLANIDPVSGASDGSAQGDIAYAFYEDYYSNQDYRSDIYVGDIEIGGTSLGSAKIEGMLIQHLDVRFRDLTP
ncbi:MAG: hypothetical protein MK096_06295 [Oleiphilaceae bacterium]|nr:hypothetical protein [Oleiphilaceae bacterium]